MWWRLNTSNDWSENTKSFRGVHLPVAHLMQVWTKCFTPVNKTQADDTQNLHQLVYKSKCGDTLQLFTWKHVHGSAKVLFLVFKTQWNKCITWHHQCFNWSQLQSGKGEGLISTVCGDHSLIWPIWQINIRRSVWWMWEMFCIYSRNYDMNMCSWRTCRNNMRRSSLNLTVSVFTESDKIRSLVGRHIPVHSG